MYILTFEDPFSDPNFRVLAVSKKIEPLQGRAYRDAHPRGGENKIRWELTYESQPAFYVDDWKGWVPKYYDWVYHIRPVGVMV